MSFPFKATVSRASNGTIELTPDNQHDLQKLDVGVSVTVASAEPVAVKPVKKKKASKKKK